jgi:alkanesulfonate monooxygenase SsuD/methylene tetrahydromethanopterin reductase-like flavin-dependent oxidoreductase (luciferase family)
MSEGQRVGFGIVYGFQGFDTDGLVAEARHAEALGFDLFCVADHLHGANPTPEPWTALTWIAAVTDRIGVMTNVLGLPYRAPAVTGKMAETLDRLSRGRLVLGLGTGGYDREFSAFGLAERSPGQKVGALSEAIQIIRGLWREPGFSFEGEHFRTRDARIEPRPAHPIPIWLGSYGPRALRLTGAVADGWVPSLGRLSLDEAVTMRSAVRIAAQDAGRDPDEITCAANLIVDFTRDGRPNPDGPRISGTSEVIARRLILIGRAGFTFQNIVLADADARDRFAAEVMPAVRDELTRLGRRVAGPAGGGPDGAGPRHLLLTLVDPDGGQR